MVNNEQTYRGLINLSDKGTLDLYDLSDEMLAKLGQVSMDSFALKYKSGV